MKLSTGLTRRRRLDCNYVTNRKNDDDDDEDEEHIDKTTAIIVVGKMDDLNSFEQILSTPSTFLRPSVHSISCPEWLYYLFWALVFVKTASTRVDRLLQSCD